MKNYKKIPYFLLLALLLFGVGNNVFGVQKVLVVVDSSLLGNHYYSLQSLVDQYLSDIVAYDNKKTKLISWLANPGNNAHQCDSLWHRLQNEYFTAINEGDIIEGAVLIGNVPVPQQNPTTGYLPLDQVYMDIINRNTGLGYLKSSFDTVSGYYTTTYNGDQYYDIWISRINAQYLGWTREGLYYLDECGIYIRYLTKLHNRMTQPASVPSRGFVMGGPVGTSVHNDLGSYFTILNLPWFAEFTAGDNSSFNWMSQLLSGPRGCINYGAFNGTLFPSDASARNARYCRYTHLNTVYLPGGNIAPYGVSVYEYDSLGWEWAGVYGHSSPELTDFFSNQDGELSNGRFSFGTLGPYSASTNYWINNGYGNGHFWYQDDVNNPNPYNRDFANKDKKVQWRWNVPSTHNYLIYAYYTADQSNVNWLMYWLYQMNINGGVSQSLVQIGAHGGTWDRLGWDINDEVNSCVRPPNSDVSYGQRKHATNPHHLTDPNWELINCTNNNGTITPDPVQLTGGTVADIIVEMTGSVREYCPTVDPLNGNYIVDAVRFLSTTDGVNPDWVVDQIVDDTTPLAGYPQLDNTPSEIFSTNGRFHEDEQNRSYEDIGDEPGGGGYSKSQFFLMKACEINNFIVTSPGNDPGAISKNLGNLYALGHNGLICMGTASSDCMGENKTPFTTALKDGKDFGEAFLAQQNSSWFLSCVPGAVLNVYALLGAGNLQAQPYVQYGSDIEQNMTISTPQSPLNLYQPVLVQNVTVSGSGNWSITSNNSGMPPGTHSEIVIRPETDFAPTGSNVVHLVANP
jgi:hypothetical protein